MVAVHRMNDTNNGGGAITSIPQNTVYANGQLVAVNGSRGTTHTNFRPPHVAGQWMTANGNPTVTINGIPVNGTGNADTCAHVRAAGSPDVFVGA